VRRLRLLAPVTMPQARTLRPLGCRGKLGGRFAAHAREARAAARPVDGGAA